MLIKLTPGKIADQLNVGVSHITANGDGTYCLTSRDTVPFMLRLLSALNTYAFKVYISATGETHDGRNFVQFYLEMAE